ncbi:MAG: type II CRISPR RNA-guided endonuclease Cas9 [Myxococcales bacterium]|nr:type II CRISPR RNA-guided endonuclease Cas9 [Myxococcales bacterium]
MKLRFGLDLGTNSIGWAVLELDNNGDPKGIIRTGVRIFKDGRDPKTKVSLAESRRVARGQRRRRDRYLQRKRYVMALLVRYGLLPEDIDAQTQLVDLDPYKLRAKALYVLLHPHHLGRLLFHLNQRRGFKSNRKAEKKQKDAGVVKDGVRRLAEKLKEAKAITLGEYLHRLHSSGQPVRVRRTADKDQAYAFYPDRASAEAEFDTIVARQRQLGLQLTDDQVATLRNAIYYQRPLKPVEPGNCTLEPNEKRAPKGHRITHLFRIWSEINHLTYSVPGKAAATLTLNQAQKAVEFLQSKKEISFEELRDLLELDPDSRFNMESDVRKKLLGDSIADQMSKPGVFGKKWALLDDAAKDEAIDRIRDEEDNEVLCRWAQERFGLSDEAAKNFAAVRVEDGFGRLSVKAMTRMIPFLQEGFTYDKAAGLAGYVHSGIGHDGNRDKLPYYGEVLTRYVVGGTGDLDAPDEKKWGKLGNPTVHIGLNQLRLIMNLLIEAHGRPHEIVVELARDLKMPPDAKLRLAKTQRDNQAQNDKAKELIAQGGGKISRDALLRYRLWSRMSGLDHVCLYTGEKIPGSKIFSDEFEVDHIVPYSASLDDSFANLALVTRRANRFKGDRTPFEAFAGSPAGFDWDAMLSRANTLSSTMAKRFGPDAREKYKAGEDFLNRQLNDTAYLSRVAREYLTVICKSVWVLPGRMTATLRHMWGLNTILSDRGKKERTDHRHHAIDAITIACTDRSLVQKMQRAAGLRGEAELGRSGTLGQFDPPWIGFRDEVKEKVRRIVVSHRVDHGKGGALHNDTAMAVRGDKPHAKGQWEVTYRKAIGGLSLGQIDQVVDSTLKNRLLLEVVPGPEKELTKRLTDFSERTGIRRVKIVDRQGNIAQITNHQGQRYKAYKKDGNYALWVVQLPDGKWRGLCESMFDANQPRKIPLWKQQWPAGKLIMCLHEDDTILMRREDGTDGLFRVVGTSGDMVTLASIHEGGDLRGRDRNPSEPFKYFSPRVAGLKARNAVPVHVDPIGRVRSPRPFTALTP